MTSCSKIFYILSFVFAIQISFAETVITEVEGSGLFVNTNPSDAVLYVDGIERGRTPIMLNDLNSGAHTLLIKKDFYNDWQMLITLSKDGRLNIYVDMILSQGQVNFSFENSITGAPLYPKEIIIDNKNYQVGQDNVSLFLPEGQKTVLVRVFGYEDVKKTIIVENSRVLDIKVSLTPAQLKLEKVKANRKVFNPDNQGSLGSVILYFSVNASGFAKFSVNDFWGNLIYETVVGNKGSASVPFDTWNQSVSWNGKNFAGDNMAGGVYTLKLSTEKEIATTTTAIETAATTTAATIEVKIDYSAEIFPLSLQRGRAGLANAELPLTLPKGSFNVESAVFAGAFSNTEDAFSSLPFSIGARFSPADTFEIGSAVNISPEIKNNSVDIGAALSVKKMFPSANKTVFALGLSYAYSNNEINLQSGISINTALLWQLPKGFAFVFSPAILWSNENGYQAVPYIAPEGGILFRKNFIIAGISAGTKYDFKNFSDVNISGEIRFFPPPSNFVFGLIANCKAPDLLFSGGLVIGFLF